jgi:hypothetical protein
LPILMPKRTTEFQKLVYLVRRHCTSSSTVTESKPLTDSATGEEREVDIYIESTVDGLPVKISIEMHGVHTPVHCRVG